MSIVNGVVGKECGKCQVHHPIYSRKIRWCGGLKVWSWRCNLCTDPYTNEELEVIRKIRNPNSIRCVISFDEKGDGRITSIG